jgi:hypothetical protein
MMATTGAFAIYEKKQVDFWKNRVINLLLNTI